MALLPLPACGEFGVGHAPGMDSISRGDIDPERVGERGCHGRSAAGLPHPNPTPEGEGLFSERGTLIPLPFRGGVRGGAVSHREASLLDSPTPTPPLKGRGFSA